MARKQVDACMFCDQNPCVCSSKSRIRTKRTKPDKTDTPLKEARASEKERSGPSAHDLMKLNASKKQPAQPVRIKRNVPARSSEEIEIERAIKVLAPILHDDELEKYSHILSLDTRARTWKRRHDERNLARGDEQRPI